MLVERFCLSLPVLQIKHFQSFFIDQRSRKYFLLPFFYLYSLVSHLFWNTVPEVKYRYPAEALSMSSSVERKIYWYCHENSRLQMKNYLQVFEDNVWLFSLNFKMNIKSQSTSSPHCSIKKKMFGGKRQKQWIMKYNGIRWLLLFLSCAN